MRRPLATLLLLCVVAWIPGFFTLPPLDRDESRFAQATKQMLESGDYVEINLGAGPRYEKPVGIYWLQAASTAILGAGARDRIWTYRVPSLLGATAAVAGTYWLALAFAGAETAFFSGLLLGLSVLLMSEAKIAKTDAVLLATIVATQGVLMRLYLAARQPETHGSPSRGLVLLGWAAFGLGVLVKGPVILTVCLTTIVGLVLWDREIGWLKRTDPLRGILVVLAITLPWAIAIGIQSHGLFFQRSLGQDFALKLIGDQEAHGAPPGYFTALVHLSFWPGSLVLLPAAVFAVAKRTDPAIRYLLVWAVTTWVMFELAPTKLPHYVLPAYPALAVLCALWLTTAASTETRTMRIVRYVSLALFVVVGLALAVFLAAAPERLGPGIPWWLYLAAAAGAIAVLAVIVPVLRGQTQLSVAMAGLSALVLYAVAGFLTVPLLSDLWLSPRMAAAVQRHSEPGDPPVATAGYAEPSITFLLGTRTGLGDGREAGAAAAKAGGLALVELGDEPAFLEAVRKGGASTVALEQIDGLNYSRGKKLRITLFRVMPGRQ
jgi:4-amino-4-deoxy-L-arabinose transferase-like glycosyltransferase